jgi:histidine ammonia-lyase
MNAPRPLTPDQLETPVVLGAARLTIEDVVAVASRGRGVALCDAPEVRARIASGAALVERIIAEGGEIYGVNTGYGDSCDVRYTPPLIDELTQHHKRYQ